MSMIYVKAYVLTLNHFVDTSLFSVNDNIGESACKLNNELTRIWD